MPKITQQLVTDRFKFKATIESDDLVTYSAMQHMDKEEIESIRLALLTILQDIDMNLVIPDGKLG